MHSSSGEGSSDDEGATGSEGASSSVDEGSLTAADDVAGDVLSGPNHSSDHSDELARGNDVRQTRAAHSDASISNDSESSDASGGVSRARSALGDIASGAASGGSLCQPAKPDATSARYVPPALRERRESSAQASSSPIGAADGGGEHARELAVVRRQVRSLLNRVASANLAPIAQQIAAIFSDVPRHAVINAITASTMQVRACSTPPMPLHCPCDCVGAARASCERQEAGWLAQALAEGPRAVDQFASVTASLVSLVAAAVPAQDLLAKWLHLLAQALEDARAADDSIAAGNVVRVLCHLYLCKAVGAQLTNSRCLRA